MGLFWLIFVKIRFLLLAVQMGDFLYGLLVGKKDPLLENAVGVPE